MENRPLSNPAPQPHENPENPSKNEDERLIEALLEKIRLQQEQIDALLQRSPADRQVGTGGDPKVVTSPTKHFLCNKYPPCNSSFATNENLEQHLREHIDQDNRKSHHRILQQVSISENTEMHLQGVHAPEPFQSSSSENISPSHPQIKSDEPRNWQSDPTTAAIQKHDREYIHDFSLWPDPEYSKASHSRNEKDFDPQLCSQPDQTVEDTAAFNLDDYDFETFLSRVDDVSKDVYDLSGSPGVLNQIDGQAMSFSWLDEQPNGDPWANWGQINDEQWTIQPFNETSTQGDFNWDLYTAPARSPSVASFGSANSGASHPPRTNRTRRKKRVSISYNELVNEPEAGKISHVKEWTTSVRSPAIPTKDDYPCDKCESSFRYRKFLESHVIEVHEKKAYWFCPVVECRRATQGFRRKANALRHVKTHLKNSEELLEPILRP